MKGRQIKVKANKIMAKYKVNKEKCLGCGICEANCPGAIEVGKNGKAKVLDSEKLAKCGGEEICPQGAIEKVEE